VPFKLRTRRKRKEEFGRNNRFIRACEAGVREVVDRKKEPCVFDDEECKSLGTSLRSGLADIIYELHGYGYSLTPTVSRKCIRTSTYTCEDTAYYEIEYLLDNENCGDNEFFSDKMEKEATILKKGLSQFTPQ
jgi:hypothetical protein